MGLNRTLPPRWRERSAEQTYPVNRVAGMITAGYAQGHAPSDSSAAPAQPGFVHGPLRHRGLLGHAPAEPGGPDRARIGGGRRIGTDRPRSNGRAFWCGANWPRADQHNSGPSQSPDHRGHRHAPFTAGVGGRFRGVGHCTHLHRWAAGQTLCRGRYAAQRTESAGHPKGRGRLAGSRPPAERTRTGWRRPVGSGSGIQSSQHNALARGPGSDWNAAAPSGTGGSRAAHAES